MPGWFWYAATGLIAALTLYVLYRHFFEKKGMCCGCDNDCAHCGNSHSCSKNSADKSKD